MKKALGNIWIELKQPYLFSLLLIAVVPLFPEYFSFLLVGCSAIFAIKDLRQCKRTLRIGIIGKLLFAFCSYQTLSCVYSAHRVSSFAVSMMWWFFFIAYLIVANLLTDVQRTERFLLCMTAVAGIVGLIACIQYRIDYFTEGDIQSTWKWLDDIVFEWFPFDMYEAPYHLRAFSTFPNPNMLAQYLVMTAPFVVGYTFMKPHSNRMQLFSGTCLFFTFAGVLFSFSRGGYLAIFMLAAFLILVNIRRHPGVITLCVAGTILFIPETVINRLFSIKTGIASSSTIADNLSSAMKPNGGSPLSPDATAEIVDKVGAETAVGERWEIWMEAIERIFDRPLFGHGAGTQITFDIFKNIGIDAPHAHNVVLQMLLEGGFVGLAIIGSIGFFVARSGIRMIRNNTRSAFWMGFSVLAFAACFMAHGMVDHPLMAPRLVFFFVMVLALIDQTATLYSTGDVRIHRKLCNKP